MRIWFTAAALFLAGTAVGYWALFTWHFLVDVLPHGGMW